MVKIINGFLKFYNIIILGYRPIPTYIPSSELQLIRDDLEASGVDVSLLDLWYKKGKIFFF